VGKRAPTLRPYGSKTDLDGLLGDSRRLAPKQVLIRAGTLGAAAGSDDRAMPGRGDRAGRRHHEEAMSFDLPALFAAGLLTFLSPCVLPLVPLYLGFLAGASVAEVRRGSRARRLVVTAIAFSLGLGAVFVALGLAATAAGRYLGEHREALLRVSGVAIALFGVHQMGLLRLPFIQGERRPFLARLGGGGSLASAFAFGAAFALGWTPCVGPVLGTALTYAASASASPARGALLLATYAAGLATPLIAVAA
jgi:cytochrome c-type biogenesis protein